MLDSFLMLGQSNMAGRGDLDEVPPIVNPRIFMLREEGWIPMKEPINPDRPFSGIGLASSFADDYVNQFGRDVGLIPCAEGATSLNDWRVGGKWFDRAIDMAKDAQKTSKITGLLWHQGENDSASIEDVQAYESKFETIMSSLTKALNLENAPLILGELGPFVGDDLEKWHCAYFKEVNDVLHRLAAKPKRAIASAESLTPRCDGIHFNSKSFRELGHRYFAEYKKLLAKGTAE